MRQVEGGRESGAFTVKIQAVMQVLQQLHLYFKIQNWKKDALQGTSQ